MNRVKKCEGKEFKFHLNVKTQSNILGLFSSFCKEVLGCQGKYCYQAPTVLSATVSQCLWFKNCVNIDSKIAYFREF